MFYISLLHSLYIGYPCISQMTTVKCDDPNTKDDEVLPIRLPIDGTTTFGKVKLIFTSAKAECLFLVTEHAKC